MLGKAPLDGKVVLVTGAAKRVGRALSIASAQAGANVIVHYRTSEGLANKTCEEIRALGRTAWCLQADLSRPDGATRLLDMAFALSPVYGLVNNAAIFTGGAFRETRLPDWEAHLAVNLTAPFLLSQAFGRLLGTDENGRIVNMLDWRATRPGVDHFAYTVSKAALAAMTVSLAQSLAPNVSVNGLALGAFLPPEHAKRDPEIERRIPLARWGELSEAGHALVFLLAGPAYVTGQIIHLDGGRHLL